MAYSLTEHPGSYAGEHPVAANTLIDSGGLVALTSAGEAVPAGVVSAVAVIGRAEGEADNRLPATGQTVLVRRGIFGLSNSASDPVSLAQVGEAVFAESPDTVRATATNGSITCPVAGLLIGFDINSLPIVDTTQAAALAL